MLRGRATHKPFGVTYPVSARDRAATSCEITMLPTLPILFELVSPPASSRTWDIYRLIYFFSSAKSIVKLQPTMSAVSENI